MSYFHIPKPQTLITSAQNVTASWADLGSEVLTAEFNSVALWVTIDINDALNFRVRALAKHTKDGAEEYVLPIKTVGSSDVAIEDHYYEFTDDSDEKYVLQWQTDNNIPYVQFQIQAGTAGATPGQVDAAYATVGRY